MTVVARIRRWWRADAIEKAVEAARDGDYGERNRTNEDAEGIVVDTFLMAGNGSVVPLVPLGSAEELTEVFERDADATDDAAS